jgi:hypothetical protein
MKAAAPARWVARGQGLFNVVGGLWPIVSLDTFELIYGAKRDVFLQKTVGGLLLAVGSTQLAAGDTTEELRSMRRLGLATAATLLAIDLWYIPRRQMRWTYWQDAACELGWIVAWLSPSA